MSVVVHRIVVPCERMAQVPESSTNKQHHLSVSAQLVPKGLGSSMESTMLPAHGVEHHLSVSAQLVPKGLGSRMESTMLPAYGVELYRMHPAQALV